MLRRILGTIVSLVVLLFLTSGAKASEEVAVTLFWGRGCPHCAVEKEYLAEIGEKYEWLRVRDYEVSSRENLELFETVAGAMQAKTSSVPFTVVCDKYFIGFADNEDFKGQFVRLLFDYREKGCEDLVANLSAEKEVVREEENGESAGVVGGVRLPFIGEIDVNDLSLPVVTLVIALADGFNPCAMWVLLFLISLLLGMKNRIRMFMLGGVFILVSGAVYFTFLAAWLNVFLFLEYVRWVRVLIGIFALGVGGYYLRDWWTNREGGCKVSGGEKRKMVFERIRKVTRSKSFVLAVVGVALLAVLVNMLELVCSAGLPAIYTNVLSMTPMPMWKYYLYLLFYIIVFMFDDMVVFVAAMITLRAVGIEGKYSRVSRLIGGVVMAVIGALMLLKPEWLMFG